MGNNEKQIQYKKGYKYQLYKDYSVRTCITPKTKIIIPETHFSRPYIILDANGNLSIYRGYAWDGASGPTIDTSSTMRPALVHDALYQCLRQRGDHFQDVERVRELADNLFYRMCREDGMDWFRAKYFYWAVRLFGDYAASPKQKKRVLTAP